MTSGVRQGCPLSPLLFVLVVDILLRRLQMCVKGDNVIRAFADDVAMIVEDSIQHLDIAVDIYKQFGSFSGLNLNWGKTIVIPLWNDPIELAKKELNSACHASAAMDFSSWGTYLGFAVGPDRNKHIWTKAKDKFATRAIVWKESHQGLHFAAMTYNVFVITIPSYIWQLAPVGKDILDEEARALRKINPGPGHWIQPCDWWLLKESWGHSMAFVSARH